MNRFSIEAIFKARDGLSAIAGKVQTRIDKMVSGVRGGLRDVDRFNSKVLGGLGSIATKATAVGLIVGGIGLAGLKNVGEAGANFEEAISAVGAVSLMTRDQVADLEKKAIELGGTTKFTASEVANAMELMGRAGFTNSQILAGVPGILSAAAAEGAEIAETAGHVSNVLKGMGLATDQATRVADVLTLASARTNSSISSLGESMKNVASTARQFKIPLEDTVASVALLQDVGLDASEAGSALNTMLTKMAAPTGAVAAKMAAMGVSFKDAKGNMLPIGDVLTQLSKALQKSGGNMDQVAFLADLVGLRGQKAAANLKDLFMSGKVGALTEELKGAAGSAEKMAALRMDNLKGDIELLGGSVDSLKIALFQTESGPLRGIVKGMGAWLDANQELIKSKLVEFIERAKVGAEIFGIGVKQGFDAGTSAARKILKPIGKLANLLGIESPGWAENVFHLGQAFGFLAVVTAGFYAYALAVKVARGVTLAFELAVKVVRFAMLAFNAVLRGVRAALVFYEIASKAGAAGAIALSLGSKAATIDMIAQRAAAFAAAGGLRAVAMAAGAVTLAVSSVLVAWQQWNELLAQTQGFEGVLAGIGAILNGESFAKGVDDFMNERAKFEEDMQKPIEINAPDLSALDAQLQKLSGMTLQVPDLGVAIPPPLAVEKAPPIPVKEPLPQIQITKPSWFGSDTSAPPPGTPGNYFGMAPQVVPPSAAPPVGTTNTTNTNKTTTDKAEVTIKAAPGTAKVTKAPRGNTKLNVPSSGGF